jgi:hypothetical protein
MEGVRKSPMQALKGMAGLLRIGLGIKDTELVTA